MKAFNGDEAVKADVLRQLREHRERGQLRWDGTGANADGCLTPDTGGGHSVYPSKYGIPEELAHLKDALFDGLSPDDRLLWPEAFMSAIHVGADLSRVWIEILADRDSLTPIRSALSLTAARAIRNASTLSAEADKLQIKSMSARQAASKSAICGGHRDVVNLSRAVQNLSASSAAKRARNAATKASFAWKQAAKATREAYGIVSAESCRRQADTLLRLLSEAPVQ